jgi:hypothetical protein
MNLDKEKIRLSLEENDGDLQGVISDLLETFAKENLSPVDTEAFTDEILDQDGPIKIAGCMYNISHLLKCTDPTNYACIEADLCDGFREIDGDYYEESEVSEIESEIESIVWDIQNEETE